MIYCLDSEHRKLEAEDVLPKINRTQAAERAINVVFIPVTLTFDFGLQTRLSEGRTKHVFRVNLTQIPSCVPEYTKTHRQR